MRKTAVATCGKARTITFPEETHQKMSEVCEKLGITQTAFIRLSVLRCADNVMETGVLI